MPPSVEIVVSNRQRTRALDRKFIQQLTAFALHQAGVESAELGLHFVSAKEMARVHEHFMNIAGSTDVITFDHGSKPPKSIHGEIFISVEDAMAQAKEFGATWQSEVARYVVHGILHLLGYDDLQPAARTKMKREENRFVKTMEAEFNLRRLEKR